MQIDGVNMKADEGKLLYFQGQENEGDGFDNISMNMACDENELIEKSINE